MHEPDRPTFLSSGDVESGMDKVLDAFESAWQQRQRPDITHYLPVENNHNDLLLRELVHIDMEFRWKSGETVKTEYYLERFPQLADDSDALLSLLAWEYELRQRTESPAVLEDFAQRFPDLHHEFADWRKEPSTNPRGRGNPSETDDIATAPPDGSAPLPSSFRSLPVVAGYEIIRVLGQGGMGVVLLAKDLKMDRLVALKVIRTGMETDPRLLERFRAEAKALGRLGHPNIVQIYQTGEQQVFEGMPAMPFMALEYVRGENLRQHLAKNAMDFSDAAQLVETLARAVHAAHELGVIHRDLKPDNVLLGSRGEGLGLREEMGGDDGLPKSTSSDPYSLIPSPYSLNPKITDFGLAKRLDVTQAQTASGDLLGTPSYMSPEQAEGKIDKIGPQTDVYALGAILYEIVTGRPPFRAATALKTIMQVIAEEPVSPRVLQSECPRDLEAICLKCLRKDPKHRYATAAALANDLHALRSGESVTARPERFSRRAWRWTRRRLVKIALVVAASAALVALVIVGIAAWRINQMDQQRITDISKQQVIDAKRKEEIAKRKKTEEEARRQNERNRRQRYADRIARVAEMWQRSPNRGLELLKDDTICPPDLRDFSWRMLHRLCSREYRTFTHLPGTVIAISRDNRSLAVGGRRANPVIRLIDIESGKIRRDLSGHKDTITTLAFSPNGKWLASGCSDGSVHIWDPNGETPLCVLPQTKGSVHAVAYSPDSKQIAIGGTGIDKKNKRYGSVQIWDTSAQKITHDLRRHTDEVSAVAYSPDGKTLVSVGRDKRVTVWDIANGKPRGTMQHGNWITSVAFAPSGKFFVTGDADGILKMWDAVSLSERKSWTGYAAGTYAIAFGPDGKTFASAHEGGALDAMMVKVWDGATGEGLPSFKAGKSRLVSLAYSSDGNMLAAGNAANTVRLWKLRPAMHEKVIQAHTGGYAVAYSPQGKLLATGGSRHEIFGELILRDAETGRINRSFSGHVGKVICTAWSPGGSVLASGGFDTTVRLFPLQEGTKPIILSGHTKEVRSVAFSSNGKLLASGSMDGHIKIWDTKTGKQRALLQGHRRTVMAVLFTPDAKKLISASHDGTIRFWDTETGSELVVWKNEINITCLALSPDGKTLAAGDITGVVKLWELQTGKIRSIQKRHIDWVFTLAFSPDGKTLASGGHDGLVHLWDAFTGSLLFALSRHPREVKALAFSPDGKTLVSVCRDGGVWFWPAESIDVRQR